MRRHPTIALLVMLVVGAAWCLLWVGVQGETPWEPTDRGLVAGWIIHFVVISAVLVLMWSRRVHWGVMVAAPIMSEIVALLFGSNSAADSSDETGAFDGFLDVFPHTVLAALLLLLVSYSLGAPGFDSHHGRPSNWERFLYYFGLKRDPRHVPR